MESGTIAFLTTSHSPFDDRIYFHQARSLAKKNKVVIIASTENVEKVDGNITVSGSDMYSECKKKKIEYFVESLKLFNPQIIICSEPLSVYAASKFKKMSQGHVKIIYDITEWYPSKKNLEGLSFLQSIVAFLKLLVFNLFAGVLCHGFIFGEYYKGLPFRILFPFKKWTLVNYFPDLSYVPYLEPIFKPDRICLGYTGKISVEKGIKNFFKVAETLKNNKPELNIKLKIIGWYLNEHEKTVFEQLCHDAKDLEIEWHGKQSFEEFPKMLSDIDILFDLRKIDLENNHCLAIKVFYYAACGKPVIYSDLKAIKREIDVSNFGYFVKPTDYNIMADYIVKYITDPGLYIQHSREARRLAETNYNWGIIEPRFLDFINMLQA